MSTARRSPPWSTNSCICTSTMTGREFRTVTGGVFHKSGGAKWDTLPFEYKKVAVRTYLVSLPNLDAGEYGFLSPGAALSSHASAQLGKMYTFRVIE